jgi:hypothetical protein
VADNVNVEEMGDVGLTLDEDGAAIAFAKTLAGGFALRGGARP